MSVIIKIQGIPIDEVVKEGVNIDFDFVDIYQLVHVPINMGVEIHGHHWFDLDLNCFNVPYHAYHIIEPHINTFLEKLF
ncbi:hypothetical protein JCM16418A_14880 [Paenibacillus pini]